MRRTPRLQIDMAPEESAESFLPAAGRRPPDWAAHVTAVTLRVNKRSLNPGSRLALTSAYRGGSQDHQLEGCART
jgi:hypothetical protein